MDCEFKALEREQKEGERRDQGVREEREVLLGGGHLPISNKYWAGPHLSAFILRAYLGG